LHSEIGIQHVRVFMLVDWPFVSHKLWEVEAM